MQFLYATRHRILPSSDNLFIERSIKNHQLMANKTICCTLLLLLVSVLLPHSSNQLQPSQYEAVTRIKQQLSFPEQETSWSSTENSNAQDFCNSEPTQMLTLVCYEDNITQLHLTGNYNLFPHFAQDFSVPALFSNLASLPYLKVLSLVSLGLTGPLPTQIGNLSSLEILNISSNFFSGSIPREVSSLRNLQTLIVDHNGFTGQVPDWLSAMPELTVLSLRNNSLSGAFPNALSTMLSLRTLVLSANNLSGQVPGLDNLTNLQVLDLEDNNLGTQFPSLPTKLVSLVLRKNKFHSTISDNLSSCYQLQKLDVSLNQLVGLFSPSILSLPSLTYLDIGGNKFTGKLVKNTSCNSEKLKFVNISENRLTGDLPDCLQFGSRIVSYYGGNCLSGEKYEDQHPYSFCHNEALAVTISPEKRHVDIKKGSSGKEVAVSSVAGGLVMVTALVGFVFLFMKKEYFGKHKVSKVPTTKLIVERISPAYALQMLKDARYISETMKLGALGIPPYRTFVLDELKEATNNFNSSNLIGEGSNGLVYKGLLTDGTVVAIRSLKVKKRRTIQTNQLELIARLRHRHLVSAIGHCYDFCQDNSSTTLATVFLVFEYVPNGTLRTFISGGGQKFTWQQRIAAGIGVARGIQFLHTGIVPGVFSNHLKITDILMDNDLNVKISKYNLPLLTGNSKRFLNEVEVVISRGCKANAGSTLSCKEKNDVYDFGAILLEIVVGRTITSSNDIKISKDILRVSLTADGIARRSIIDPAVHKECTDESLKTLIELCVRCLSDESSERPTVEDVIWNLQFAAQESIIDQESPLHSPSPPQ